jgi:hypothetical protein
MKHPPFEASIDFGQNLFFVNADELDFGRFGAASPLLLSHGDHEKRRDLA